MIDPNTGTRQPFAGHLAVCFDPATLTMIAIGGSLIGGGVSAIGAMQQGQAAEAAANYNAAVAERNAVAANQQTRSDVAAQAREQAKKAGAVRAAYGANGLDFSGTALDVFEDQALDAEYDLRLTKYKGDLRAAGYKADAQLNRMNANASSSAGLIGAASAVVGGGTNAAGVRLRAGL